jgi:hypothetical protein
VAIKLAARAIDDIRRANAMAITLITTLTAHFQRFHALSRAR